MSIEMCNWMGSREEFEMFGSIIIYSRVTLSIIIPSVVMERLKLEPQKQI